MSRSLALLMAAGAALLAVAGCSGKGREETLVLEGSVALLPPTSTAFVARIAIDPDLHVVYAAGGQGGTGMTSALRIDVADPAHMTVSDFAPGFGGGVAVDPTTHLVATTDGLGFMAAGNTSTLGIFDPSGAMADAVTITGCGGEIAAAPGGRFAVSTQCVDSFDVYDYASRAIVFHTRAGGVGAVSYHDPATGRWYQNRTPKANNGGGDDALVLSPVGPTAGALVATDFPFDGAIVGVDPARGRLWFSDEYGSLYAADGLAVLDGTSDAPILPTTVTNTSAQVALAASIGRAFVTDRSLVRLLDAQTTAEIDALDFAQVSGGFTPSGPFVVDGERAYIIGRRSGSAPRLFVVRRRLD